MVAPPSPSMDMRRAARLLPRAALLVFALLLVAPTSQAWVMRQYGPVTVSVDVNADPDTDPTDPEQENAGATVLVCSDEDPVTRLDVEDDPGWISIWVPLGTDETSGSQRTTAGCGEDDFLVEVTLMVNQRPWGGLF